MMLLKAWKPNRKILLLWLAFDICVGVVVAFNHVPLAGQFERYALAAEDQSNGGSSLSSALWTAAAVFKPDTIGREEQSLLSDFQALDAQRCTAFSSQARAMLTAGGDAYYLYQGLGESAEFTGDVKSAVYWTLAYLRLDHFRGFIRRIWA